MLQLMFGTQIVHCTILHWMWLTISHNNHIKSTNKACGFPCKYCNRMCGPESRMSATLDHYNYTLANVYAIQSFDFNFHRVIMIPSNRAIDGSE